MTQATSFMANPNFLSWTQAVEGQVHKMEMPPPPSPQIPLLQLQVLSRRSSTTSIASDGLQRARQAADSARAVASSVAIATALAAERAISKQTLQDQGTNNYPRGGGGSGKGRTSHGAPQRLTEQALLQHASRSAADDTPPVDLPPRRGSRFVPDALPFHCAADYSLAGPSSPRLAAA